jgi:hypothetical protein
MDIGIILFAGVGIAVCLVIAGILVNRAGIRTEKMRAEAEQSTLSFGISEKPTTKICTYCAEEIKFEATVCKFCGKTLIESKEQKSLRFWLSMLILGLALSFIGYALQSCGVGY